MLSLLLKDVHYESSTGILGENEQVYFPQLICIGDSNKEISFTTQIGSLKTLQT